MKANRLIWVIVLQLLGTTPAQLYAQQTEADRKLFLELKTRAEKGDIQAMSSIGFNYEYGMLGEPTNATEAVKWYEKAANCGDAFAQFSLGKMSTRTRCRS